jgi:hypothetical protein
MFVLNPGGSSGSAAGSQSILRQHLLFFGKFGLYFGVLRIAFVFMSGRDEAKAIAASSSSSQ